jgi:hypothetical protein
MWEHGGKKWYAENQGECSWVAGIQLGMGRAKTVEKGEGKKERLGLMGAWRWSGWCSDKGTGFSTGPYRPVCTFTITDNNKTMYKGMNHSLLLQSCL